MYAGQWLAVVGFLPTVFAQAQVGAQLAGALTALVAAVNIGGNIAAGRLLRQGTAPRKLLWTGFSAMALGAMLAFLPALDAGPAVRTGAVLLFSLVGGLVPATLFALCAAGAGQRHHRHHRGLDAAVLGGGAVRAAAAGRLGRTAGGRLAMDLGADGGVQRGWRAAGVAHDRGARLTGLADNPGMSSPSPSLSVVIAAKNEAHHIADCVRSASFADEILVLDSGSTDATAALAAEQGARVVPTDWPGYGPQQQRGIAMARCDWVLSLDADERISAELQAEIRAAIASGAADGYRLPRLSSFAASSSTTAAGGRTTRCVSCGARRPASPPTCCTPT